MTAASDTRTRFQKRQWQRRLVALRPLLVTAAAVVLVAFVGWIAFFSSWLAATAVDVSGEETVSQQRILDAADVQLGVPLARLDLGEIEARVALVPVVAEVSVHRSWPHTVSIDITEREPIAAIHRAGSWWVMDGEGVEFRPTEAPDPTLPVVEVGAQVPDDALAEVAGVIRALPTELMGEVRQISARSMDSIQLQLSGRRTIVWGSAAESDRKAEVVDVLLGTITASTYDVSVPDQPTTSR
jgi:cell division protein FtsQ